MEIKKLQTGKEIQEQLMKHLTYTDGRAGLCRHMSHKTFLKYLALFNNKDSLGMEHIENIAEIIEYMQAECKRHNKHKHWLINHLFNAVELILEDYEYDKEACTLDTIGMMKVLRVINPYELNARLTRYNVVIDEESYIQTTHGRTLLTIHDRRGIIEERGTLYVPDRSNYLLGGMLQAFPQPKRIVGEL